MININSRHTKLQSKANLGKGRIA